MLATTYKLTQHHKTEDCLAYNSYKKHYLKSTYKDTMQNLMQSLPALPLITDFTLK